MSQHVHLDCTFEVPNSFAILLWPNITTAHPLAHPLRKLASIHTAINDLCKRIYAEKRHPFDVEHGLFEWAHSLSNIHKHPGITFRDVPRAYWCWKCGLRYTTNTPSFGFVCRMGTGCRADGTLATLVKTARQIEKQAIAGILGGVEPGIPSQPAKIVPKLKTPGVYDNNGKSATSNAPNWPGFKLRPYGDSPSVGYDDQSGDDICADVLPEGIVRRKA